MKRNQHGFTLIEVLVAMSLMSIVVAGLAALNISTIGADTRSSRSSTATALARDKLETLRSLPRTSAEWANGVETGLNSDGTVGSGLFRREWTIQSPYNGYVGLARVAVTVSWQDPDTGAVELASLYR